MTEIKSPPKTIIYDEEKYVFIGGVPVSSKNRTRGLKTSCGRKVVFVDRDDRWTRVYISAKFYPEKCRANYPYHGREMLTGDEL